MWAISFPQNAYSFGAREDSWIPAARVQSLQFHVRDVDISATELMPPTHLDYFTVHPIAIEFKVQEQCSFALSDNFAELSHHKTQHRSLIEQEPRDEE